MLTATVFVFYIGLALLAFIIFRSTLREAKNKGNQWKLPTYTLWFSWDGTVDRRTYALVGLAGFAIKHQIDRLVASCFYDKPWSIFNYFIPPTKALSEISSVDRNLFLTLLFISLPFIWVGLTMTLRRLRSAGLPLPLVFLFFVPILNLLFFLMLAAIPSRNSLEDSTGKPIGLIKKCLDRVIPKSTLGNAFIAAGTAAIIGGIVTAVTIQEFEIYGWTVFVAAPFGMGFLAALLYGYHEPKTLKQSLGVATLSTILLGGILFAVAFEGVICLLMSLPVGLALALIGGAIGYVIQKRPIKRAPLTLFALFIFFPLLMGMEVTRPQTAPVFEVKTSVDIAAPPEKVWKNVVTFSEIPPPNELLFKIGIAYPIRAQIEGKGSGAVRYCVFSTGPFVEPIQVWDKLKLLKFSVTENPAPMQEWTPYKEIHPPHLDHFLVSNGGQFRLIPLPNGGTRLEGTTWYLHHMWPASYWQIWSDGIIHKIHSRVLDHIKSLSEAKS